MALTVDKVLKIAAGEVGYLEKKSNSRLDDKTANAGSNNYTKYARDMHAISSIYPSPGPNALWCDMFVDWCFVKAYGKENAKKLLGGWSAYTPTSAQYYKNMGRYYKTPKVGDQIFFKNSQRINHTGLVVKVTDTRVYTIEGNTSSGPNVIANGGCVARKDYLLTNSRIAGYGRPNYDISSTKVSTKVTTGKTPKNKDFTIKNVVTASTLNIRDKASTKGKVVGSYKKGTKVTITKACGEWYKTDKGYVSAKYISSTSATTTENLNYREGNSVRTKKLGTYKKGTKVLLLAKKNNWYLTPKGWISGGYLK